MQGGACERAKVYRSIGPCLHRYKLARRITRESGGPGAGLVGFVGFMAREIGVPCLVKAAFAVDGGVDMVIRKNEAIFGRIVRQALHLTELEVFLEAAVDALRVEGQEFEVFRFDRENARGSVGGLDSRVLFAEFAGITGKGVG
jgi:hypothetical protein